jgi:dihydrolipoamide dehydrogenase
VAVVEKRKSHGGTCLNVGCIPSKALLHASSFMRIEARLCEDGHRWRQPKRRFPKMMLQAGSHRRQHQGHRLPVEEEQGRRSSTAPARSRAPARSLVGSDHDLETKNIVIATGSDVAKLKGIEIDEKRIVSSTGALELKEVPQKMVVIGAA